MPRYVPPYDSKEQHLPGMNYAGPGTNVAKRLANGVEPVDALDKACLAHDMVTEPRGPYTSGGVPAKLLTADRKLMRACDRLMAKGYQPLWKVAAVREAMWWLVTTKARGRS